LLKAYLSHNSGWIFKNKSLYYIRKCIVKYIIAFVLGLLAFNLDAQNYVYSYTDPCTGVLKTITVPINGSVSVSYYGEVGTFNGQDFQNGVFETWANQKLAQYQNISPCAQIVGVATTIGVTQSTAINTLSILNSLSALADMAAATNMLGGAVNTVNGGSSSESNNENKEQNGNINSSSNNGSSSSGGISTSNPAGSTGTSSTQSTSSTATPTQTSTGEGQTSNPSTEPTNPSTEPTIESSSSTTTGTSGEGSIENPATSSGTEGSGSQSSTSGNGENGSGSGNASGGGTNETQTQETQAAPEEGGKTNITGGSSNTIKGSTTTSNSPKSKNGNGAPSVIASADFVGFNFQNTDVTTGLKATGGYTALRWDGKRSWGGLLDYTSALQGPNLTGFYAWIKPGRVTLLSGTLTVGFEGRGSLYGTVSGGQMISFKKLKTLKLVYMATVSYGAVYQTSFIGTAVIAGGMYDFKIGKRIDIKLMDLMVYSPYTSYYNDIVMKSPYVMIPSIGTNISITRKFKFNINAGGAWSLGQSTLNYTVTCGTRLMLGE
jgi:hypothetical protein